MYRILDRFWFWYERYLFWGMTLAAGLFIWQLVHLYWLFADVILFRLYGQTLFPVSDLWQYLIIFVDYTEIPALISASLVYINELRKIWSWKNILFLIFLNSQWLHLFWITDEFIVSDLREADVFLSAWLVWLAIFIDYLELPVIYDTYKKLLKKSLFYSIKS